MRKKNFPWTYIIVLASLAFAAWVYFGVFKKDEQREAVKAESSALLPFSISNVTEISLHSSGFDTVIGKSGKIWKVEKPYIDLGEATSIEGFLASLSTEKLKATVVEAPDINWKTYGLEIPVVTGIITTKSVKRIVAIGTVPAYDGSVYARIDNANRVDLVSPSVQAILQKDPRDFRDKHFFPFAEHPELKSAEFKTLEISRPGFPSLKFEKMENVWFESPAKAASWPLDQKIVKNFVDSIVALRGNDVWGEDKKDKKVIAARRLDRPGTSIRLTSDKNLKYDVKIASLEKESSVAAGLSSARPLVFSVYKAQIESLSKTIDDFRDLKFPFFFHIADVRAIELERPKGEISLPIIVKKDGKWLLDPVDTRFTGREVKSDSVDRLLSEMVSLNAKRMLPKMTPQPKLGAKHSVRAAFFGEKSKKLAEFIFNIEDETVRVTSTRTPGKIFEIEKTQFDQLTLDVMTPPKDNP